MRSAILLRMRERSAGEVLPQASLAACAASSAFSMSSAVERATSHSGRPVTGVGLVKYCPRTGGTHSPPMKLSYFGRMTMLFFSSSSA